MIRGLLAGRLLVGVLCALAGAASAGVQVEAQRSGVEVRLRGISAVDANVAWASGQKGTVLRTLDGGAHWQKVAVPQAAEALDFRDIEGFDATTAVVLSIGPGESSRVYRTEDGGASWTQVLRNRDERAFFDCMAFEGERGWLMGDPVDGRFQLYVTRDGGRHWMLDPNGPPAVEGESAFAASGTCIARLSGAIAVGSGGGVARLHVRRDGDPRWWSFDSGMGRGKPEAGVFSLAPNATGAFAVGGDYKEEHGAGNAVEWRGRDRREPLRVVDAPRGYRSGAACVDRDPSACIAVGPSGVDAWDGTAWTAVEAAGYDAIDLHGDIGWASGDRGRIARVAIDD